MFWMKANERVNEENDDEIFFVFLFKTLFFSPFYRFCVLILIVTVKVTSSASIENHSSKKCQKQDDDQMILTLDKIVHVRENKVIKKDFSVVDLSDCGNVEGIKEVVSFIQENFTKINCIIVGEGWSNLGFNGYLHFIDKRNPHLRAIDVNPDETYNCGYLRGAKIKTTIPTNNFNKTVSDITKTTRTSHEFPMTASIIGIFIILVIVGLISYCFKSYIIRSFNQIQWI